WPPDSVFAGGQRVALLEVLPGLDGDALGLIDLQLRALERDLVLAARELVVDERRVLGGVLAVDPDLGPRNRVDGDRAVAATAAPRILAGDGLLRRRSVFAGALAGVFTLLHVALALPLARRRSATRRRDRATP